MNLTHARLPRHPAHTHLLCCPCCRAWSRTKVHQGFGFECWVAHRQLLEDAVRCSIAAREAAQRVRKGLRGGGHMQLLVGRARHSCCTLDWTAQLGCWLTAATATVQPHPVVSTCSHRCVIHSRKRGPIWCVVSLLCGSHNHVVNEHLATPDCFGPMIQCM